MIEGQRITAIEKAGVFRDADEIINLANRLLVPGLINGHFHSHEHFQRGRLENLPLELWQHYVRAPVSVQLTPRQVYLRTLIGAIECLRTGVTCIVDDLSVGSHIRHDLIDAALQAYDDLGIRAMVGFAMMDRPIVNNFPYLKELFPIDLLEKMRSVTPPPAQEYLNLMRRLAGRHHPQEKRVGTLVSISAPQRCSEQFLLACRRLADELKLPLITHVHETRLQVVTGLEFYGSPIVEYLGRINFLKEHTSLIHAVWLNPREIRMLADSGATAQHNPWSNLMLGSGCQPVRALLEAGVNVSMGSDGSCSTVSVNMLNVLGSAAALSKVRGDDYSTWLSAAEALTIATQGGAKALGFDGALGVIEGGALADLVAYRLDTVTFTPLNDPVRQLVYGERGAGLDFVMVTGEPAIREGQLTRVNEAQLLTEIQEEFKRLESRFEDAEASAIPIRKAIESIYRRSLATAISPDTYPAKLP
jgi:guanine deaminase